MGRGSSNPYTGKAVAFAQDTAKQGAAAAGGDATKGDSEINNYKDVVMRGINTNPYTDPDYLQKQRILTATAASGTEQNAEEKLNEERQRTGGYNTSGTAAWIDEMRREKSREMNASEAQQAANDYGKYQQQKMFYTTALGQVPDYFLKKYGADRSLQGQATSAQSSAAGTNQQSNGSSDSLWGSVIGGVGTALSLMI